MFVSLSHVVSPLRQIETKEENFVQNADALNKHWLVTEQCPMFHEAKPESVEQEADGVPLRSILDPQAISSIASSDKRKTPRKKRYAGWVL